MMAVSYVRSGDRVGCGGFGCARAGAGTRVGLLSRRRLGIVLDARHGAGRTGVWRTALGFQMALGFALTVPTIWLLPFLERVGWRWAFVFLVPGPVLRILAMLQLRRLRLSVP